MLLQYTWKDTFDWWISSLFVQILVDRCVGMGYIGGAILEFDAFIYWRDEMRIPVLGGDELILGVECMKHDGYMKDKSLMTGIHVMAEGEDGVNYDLDSSSIGNKGDTVILDAIHIWDIKTVNYVVHWPDQSDMWAIISMDDFESVH